MLIINILKSFKKCIAYPLIIYKMTSFEISSSIAFVSFLKKKINKIVNVGPKKKYHLCLKM